MAIQNILPDLTHIARTTYQWEHTADKYEIIPNGVLCIEFVKVDQTLIKIGDGHHIYKQLPYVSSIDLKNYYTKEETDNRIIEIFNELKSIRIKGEVSDLSNLPTDNNTEGDLWFVRRTSPTGHSRYDEYVWYKNNWESIGLSESDIDLSEYAKKEYVDEKIEEVDEKIDRYMHTHSNKEILDQITAPFTTEKDEKLESLHNYDDTEIRRIIDERTHTHSNKSILDQTSAAYTTDKDDKLASLENYDDTAVQDRLTLLERIAHFHENQEILNRTTAAFTREQAITLLDCKDFEGTDGTNDGYHGFVPAPTASDAGKVLGANGQWVPMSGGGGGDTVAEGGGISITTDAQTGNKVIAVNAGTGLSIDPVTGELNVTGGGGGGDTVAEGGGISITTDPQTGDKVISVDVGDNLEIDPQTGELNVTGVDYTAGKGIFIGNEYQNVEYIKNSGNYDQIILTDIIPNFSDKLEMDIKFGAATGNTSNDAFFGCYNIHDTNEYMYAAYIYCVSNSASLSYYNHFKWTAQLGNNHMIDNPIGISYDGSTSQRMTLTLQSSSGTWGSQSANFPSSFDSNFIEAQRGIAIFGSIGTSHGSTTDEFDYVDSMELTVYGVKLYDSNDTLLHNLVPVKKLSDNSGGLYDTVTNKFYGNSGNGSFVTGPAVETDDRIINAKIGDGLQFDSNNAIEVNTGDGLSVNQDNELEVNLGSGLQFDSNGAIEVTETGIDFEAGNGLEMVQEGYYDQLPLETYSHCDYVENTNDAHFQLDYLPPQNVRITGKFSPVLALTDTPVFGSRTGSNANGHQFVLWCSAQSTNVTPYKMGFVSPGNQWGTASEANGGTITSFVQNDIINFDIDFPNAQVLINDEYFQAINVSSSASATVKVGIFSCAKGDTPAWEYKFCGKIYGMKFYVGNAMVVNLVPAVRDSDSVVGFYDNVNDVFYTSITSTAFSTDTSSITKDEPSTQTVNVLNVIPATSGNIGGVIPRRALTVDLKGRLDVDLATSTTPGIVTPKEGLNVDANGELSVAKATSSTMGGVKIGSGIIQAPDGTVNVSAMEPFDIGDGLELEYDSEDALPSGYAYVDYISSNPTSATASSAQARTVIDYVPNANTRYKVRGSRDNANNSTSRNYFCGARQSSSDYQSALLFTANGTNKSDVGFLYGSGQWANVKYNMDYVPGDIVVIEADANSLKVDGTTVATYTPAGNPPSFKIGVFGATANGNTTPGWTDSYPMNGKIYYLKIYEGNTLVVNLIPAYRYADDTVGFYDNINDKFYTSITNYPFTTDMATLNPDPENRKLNVVPATANTIGGIKVGNNLSIDSDGVLSANVINYSSGHAIEITGDLSIDKFRWEITANAGDSMVAFRYFEYSDSSHIAFTVQAGTIEWSDGSTVSYPSGYDETFAGMMENRTKCTVTGWTGDKTLIMTFRLAQSIMLSDIAYFRWQTDDYMSGRQPQEFNIYAHDSINDEWILLKSVTDHALVPSSSNTWSTYIDIEPPEIESGSINVKYGNGLTLNQNNELEVATASASTLGGIKVGDGLSIAADGTLSAIGGGGSGGGSEYVEGDAIEFSAQTLSFNVDAIRWDISYIKNTSQQVGPYTQVRSVEFCDSSNVVHTLDSGSAIWEDGTTITYASVSETIDELVADTGKMCAVWRYPNHVLKLTFNLDTPTPLSDIVKFRMKTANDASERDPKAWKIYVRNATTQQWYLVHETSDAEITDTRDTWSDYYAFTSVTETSINVKYGDGLSIDENGALSTTTYLAGDGIGINPYGGLVVENTEYYFDTQVSCEIRGNFNRTFQKTTADPVLGVIWKCYDSNKLWGGPLFVGLTADSVKYTTEGTTYNAKGTFTYLGRTWYYSDTSYYVQNPQDHDYLGNLQVFTDAYDYVTDVVDAAKRLIDTAHVYTNNQEEISVKIGQRLKIEADGSVNAKGYLEGEGISIDTTDYLLPTGYTRIKALSSTLNGNQYINTGYKLNPDTIIDMKCTLYKRGTSVWAIPLGARVYNSYAIGGMLFVTTNSDSLVPSTGVDTPSLWIESSLNYPPSGQINLWYNDIIDLHFDNQSVTCENQRTHEQSVITSQTAISATSNYDLYVFATNNGNNAAFFGVMDLYELTISENNVIIHRYIPCKRDSDDKYGLYDIIDNEFKLSPNNNLFSYVPGLPIDDIYETISLLPATTNTLGGVKIGDGLSIDPEGYVSSKLYEAGQGITFDEAASDDQFKVRNLEYYFDNQVSWQINGDYGPRTFTRLPGSEQCLIAIVQTTSGGRIWTTPACIGLTETSCKYSNSYDSYIIGPDATFDYKGYTWYIGMNYGLLNSTGVDLLGNVQGPINLTSIDTGNNQNLDLVGKAIIDLAGLVVYEDSIDVWNSGTGWLNGAYNDSQSDQFWTNWYYTYHSKQDEYFEVPAGAIKMRLIGISNENDSRLQGGGVDCFNSSHHHFKSIGCVTDEWADIPEGTVYLQFGVKWNELNDRTISSSDIKSVNIEFYYDTPRNDVINAKLGNGLEFDSNDAIQVKLGDGLTVNNRNELEVNYGNGLEIVSNSQYRSEYYFNTQVQCQVHTDNPVSGFPSNRTYQKTTTEPALCCLWEVSDSGYAWTGPLIVGTTATSVQYTTQDTSQTVNYQNTFTYLGQTWYTSGYPDFLNSADHEDKLGNLQYLGSYAAVSDQIQAAKDLINLALINVGSLQAKLGSGLSFDANGAIQVTGGGGGSGDTVAEGNGISITTDQQTGNKVIAVNAGSGLQINQSTHELEATGVSSISATPNTPGSITITNGSTPTPTPLSVISQMGGASSSTAGSAGYVPAPASGDNDAYLRGDGVWDDSVVTEDDELNLVFVPDDYQPS